MRMLMPSQSKKIQPYRDALPLFVAHKVEDQLSQIHSPVVPLRSGGYLVINQTEALVAVDVNSGKSTRERNVESTALKTNMEAAEEAARQLRLRDLAGLIVIDFIDMDEAKNNRAVEKKLKDCLANDRARIQMGKISGFGLMEISRQRRRTGVLEGTTHVCPACNGLGRIRSTESSALNALRAVEIELARGGAGAVTLRLPSAVALYILNEKRGYLTRLEQTQGLAVTVLVDEALGHAEHALERTAAAEPREDGEPQRAFSPAARPTPVVEDPADDVVEDEEDEDEEVEAEAEADTGERSAPGDTDENGKRRRRRRRRGGRGENGAERAPQPLAARGAEADEDGPADEASPAAADEDERSRRRRRGRRGGRRLRDESRAASDPYTWTRARAPAGEDPYIWFDPLAPQASASAPGPAADSAAAPAPAREERRPRREAAAPAPEPVQAEALSEAVSESAAVQGASDAVAVEAVDGADATPPPAARRTRTRKRATKADAVATVAAAPIEAGVPEVDGVPAPVDQPAVHEPAPEEPLAAEPQPIVSRLPEMASEPEAEPAPPLLEVVASLPTPPPAEPDPAEISAPPVQPRRGWWRRGG
jgi:ribonuclease E